MKTFLIVILALLVVAGGVYAWRANDITPDGDEVAVICTMDAKLCPDGSYVGRSGPNCEFAQCPSAVTVTGTVTSTSTKGTGTSTTTSTTTTVIKKTF